MNLTTHAQLTERRPPQRFGRAVHGEGVAPSFNNGQAGAADSNTLTKTERREDKASTYNEPEAVGDLTACRDDTRFLDQTSEHIQPTFVRQ